MRKIGFCAAATLSLLAVAAAVPAAAEIERRVSFCPDQKLCAWYKAKVAAPNGWVEDKDFGSSHFLTTLFPDKADPSDEDPMIYVQASLHLDKQTLEQNIAENQEIWRKSEPLVKITPLPPVARAGDNSPFQLFLYENPTHPQQAFELIAFSLEKQADGSHYIVTVVDTASNRKAIDASREAYLSVLKGL